MSTYTRPGEKVEEKKRTPRDGVEYVPSSLLPSSYSHNPDHPFPNDLLHFPHATTDIHAHVMVCDLINDEKSIATIADDWHLTFAQTDHIASLPIVDREVEALKKLVKLRAELMSLVYGDRAIRSLARVANMSLLEPDSRGYTEQAANARASLVRLASTALLSDARRRTAPTRTTLSRTANVNERTSASESESDSAPPSPAACPTGALHDLPPASSFKGDADSSASASERTPPTESASDSAPPSQPVHCGGAAGSLEDLPLASDLTSDANSTASVSERTSEPFEGLSSGATSSRRAVEGEAELVPDSANDATSADDSNTSACSPRPFDSSASSSSRTDRATEPSDATTPSDTPGREEAPAIHSPSEALRAAAGSTQTLRNPSRRARDHPTRPAA